MKQPARISSLIVAGLVVLGLGTDAALGCPMCKEAASENPGLSQGLMTSILFMMSMPFMLLAGFSFAFWRLSKEGPRGQDEAWAQEHEPGDVADE